MQRLSKPPSYKKELFQVGEKLSYRKSKFTEGMIKGRIKQPMNIREGGEPFVLCSVDANDKPIIEDGVSLVSLDGFFGGKKNI